MSLMSPSAPFAALVVLTAASVAAVGLISGDTESAEALDAPQAPPTELRFEDCVHRIGVFPIDEADAAPFLPDGFAPEPFLATGPGLGEGLPGLPGESATVQLLAQSCVPTAGQGLPEERVSIVQAWLYVDPPDAFESPEAEAYLAVTSTVTDSAAVRDALGAMGLPIVVGDVAMDATLEAPRMTVAEDAASGDGAAVRLRSAVPDLARETVPEHLRLIGVRDGRVAGVVDFLEDPHTHVLIGTATLHAESGEPRFPAPSGPGVAIHVLPGYAMTWKSVPSP